MSLRLLGFFILLLGSAGDALGGDDRGFAVGSGDLVFEGTSPVSSDAELKRRFGATNDPPAFDLSKEKFRVIVPSDYRPDAGWGLFVWIDASPQPLISKEWEAILASKKLLYVAAHDSGNSRDLFDRCRLAIDAVHNMKKRFTVDPDRVYVSGHSGGGRVASTLGVAYADVFAGSFPIVGVNFYKPIPTGEPNQFWFPKYRPDPKILEAAKAKNRYVLLTGEKDFNLENTLRVFREGFKASGFRHVLYLEVPGMGHSRPPGEWLARGIDFLDSRSAPRKDSPPAGGTKPPSTKNPAGRVG